VSEEAVMIEHVSFDTVLMVIPADSFGRVWPMLSDEDKAYARRKVGLMSQVTRVFTRDHPEVEFYHKESRRLEEITAIINKEGEGNGNTESERSTDGEPG
jgi:hypothetical protein